MSNFVSLFCALPVWFPWHYNQTTLQSNLSLKLCISPHSRRHSTVCLSVCQSVVWTHSKCSSSRVLRVSHISRLNNGILVNDIKGFSSYSTGNTHRVCYQLSGRDVQFLCWVGCTCAVKGNVVTVRAMRAYRGSLTSALAGGECLLHLPAALPWQGTRAGLNDSEKKQSLASGGTRTPACPAWSLVTVASYRSNYLIK